MNINEFKQKNSLEILKVENYVLSGGRGSVPVLKFPLLETQKWVKHCFTTRLGGVSGGIFSTLNLSFQRGDERPCVEENFRRVAEVMQADICDFVFTDQTHTRNVLRVGEKDAGSGIIKKRNYQNVDGLITNDPGIILCAFFADCVPLYFLDPIHHAIGLSHSGWKGTIARIGAATLQEMYEEFGTNPGDVIAAIGPSICQDCYEVSEDVASAFAHQFPYQKEEILIPKKENKYQLDLWKANEIVLLEAGIAQSHLAVTNLCTCCNRELLFSHRGSRGKRGNLGAFLGIREDEKVF